MDQAPKTPLYNVWNMEGEPNVEEMAILHEMHEGLKEEPDFVGIVPFGSTTKGFNIPNSDTDIIVLYRFHGTLDKPVSSAESVLASFKGGQFDFLMKVDTLRDKLQLKYGKRINLLTQIVDPLVYTAEDGIEKPNLQAFLQFPRHITGDKSAPLLAQAQGIFRNLPPEQQREMVADLTGLLVYIDTLSIEKMKERGTLESDTAAHDWLVERKALWHGRVLECFTPEEAS